MLRAVIFDFNGILVDDEPIHLALFQKVLSEEGITLDEKDYYARYLGMDDRGCFTAAFRDRARTIDETALQRLIERKGQYYREAMRTQIRLFPGVKTLLPLLSARYPLAIASGALRSEIETLVADHGLRDHFRAIVSAEDVRAGKPDPEIFLRALDRLNAEPTPGGAIEPGQCLVVEDSREGIRGAGRAGMKRLAVTNSHPAEELAEADAVVDSLEKVTPSYLESLFG